jgi:hypothetical protein
MSFFYDREYDDREKSGKYTVLLDGTIEEYPEPGVIVMINNERKKIMNRSAFVRVRKGFKDGDAVKVYMNPEDINDFYLKAPRKVFSKGRIALMSVGIIFTILGILFGYFLYNSLWLALEGV